MSVILMTTLFYKALIVQGEIWCWSLLGVKGLTSLKRPFKSEWNTNWYIPVPSSLCLVNFIFCCFCLINLYRLSYAKYAISLLKTTNFLPFSKRKYWSQMAPIIRLPYKSHSKLTRLSTMASYLRNQDGRCRMVRLYNLIHHIRSLVSVFQTDLFLSLTFKWNFLVSKKMWRWHYRVPQ